MSLFTFYRPTRLDGGVRTGIGIDAETVLGQFRAGRRELDPALLWYVDLRCEGFDLPREAENARESPARWIPTPAG